MSYWETSKFPGTRARGNLGSISPCTGAKWSLSLVILTTMPPDRNYNSYLEEDRLVLSFRAPLGWRAHQSWDLFAGILCHWNVASGGGRGSWQFSGLSRVSGTRGSAMGLNSPRARKGSELCLSPRGTYLAQSSACWWRCSRILHRRLFFPLLPGPRNPVLLVTFPCCSALLQVPAVTLQAQTLPAASPCHAPLPPLLVPSWIPLEGWACSLWHPLFSPSLESIWKLKHQNPSPLNIHFHCISSAANLVFWGNVTSNRGMGEKKNKTETFTHCLVCKWSPWVLFFSWCLPSSSTQPSSVSTFHCWERSSFHSLLELTTPFFGKQTYPHFQSGLTPHVLQEVPRLHIPTWRLPDTLFSPWHSPHESRYGE